MDVTCPIVCVEFNASAMEVIQQPTEIEVIAADIAIAYAFI